MVPQTWIEATFQAGPFQHQTDKHRFKLVLTLTDAPVNEGFQFADSRETHLGSAWAIDALRLSRRRRRILEYAPSLGEDSSRRDTPR